MKKENRYKNTAVIDGDYIIWIACNKNKVLEEGVPKKLDDKFVYEDKTLEQALDTFDSYITDLLHLVKADSYILCMTGKRNFRYNIDPSYKANRVGIEKPMWFKEVRDHMINVWGGIQVDALEADDLVNIICNSLENAFIVAVDKDLLNCLPGRHFDARKGKASFVTVTEDQANFAFAKSILTGDAIDGIPNMKRGYGPKTAEKDLLASEETTPLAASLKIYEKEFGQEEGFNRFKKQYTLLKIIGSLEELPENITFEIPEPICYDCVETIFSEKEYTLDF